MESLSITLINFNRFYRFILQRPIARTRLPEERYDEYSIVERVGFEPTKAFFRLPQCRLSRPIHGPSPQYVYQFRHHSRLRFIPY